MSISDISEIEMWKLNHGWWKAGDIGVIKHDLLPMPKCSRQRLPSGKMGGHHYLKGVPFTTLDIILDDGGLDTPGLEILVQGVQNNFGETKYRLNIYSAAIPCDTSLNLRVSGSPGHQSLRLISTDSPVFELLIPYPLNPKPIVSSQLKAIYEQAWIDKWPRLPKPIALSGLEEFAGDMACFDDAREGYADGMARKTLARIAQDNQERVFSSCEWVKLAWNNLEL